MERLLRQSTAISVRVGPFLDDTDGKTPETALNAAATDLDFYKGVTKSDITDTDSAGNNDFAHLANGHYSLELTTGNVDTLGSFSVAINATGALPVWEDFVVIPAMVYDSLVLGTDKLEGDVTQFGGSAGLFTAGRPEVDVTRVNGAAATQQAYPPNFGSMVIDSNGWVVLQNGSLVTAKLGVFALAKGTNLTGLNDIAATAIVTSGAITTSGGAVSNVTTLTTYTGNTPQTGDVYALASGAAGFAAINNKTTNLPSDPADASDINTAISAVNTAIGTLNTAIAALSAVKPDNKPDVDSDGKVTTNNPARIVNPVQS